MLTVSEQVWTIDWLSSFAVLVGTGFDSFAGAVSAMFPVVPR